MAVTCHGIELHIISSDLRIIEKVVIYRLLSLRFPRVRDIPRIFLFDACDGAQQRSKGPEDAAKGEKMDKEVVKGIGLADISSADDWSSKNDKNPDFNLVLIQAANVGFQAKMSAVSGSYLISEVTFTFLSVRICVSVV